ncbi:OTU5 [Symbiodinium pilosum]|uniref:OTU5 protein n=1 Tax=Symbiodinium pilosum TaxID=2952 RepID=A0A812R5Y5_SYMPI|nr:OTU5 [Symbiodinium pilosum]
MCWLAGCANGIPNMSEQEWSNVDHGSAVKVPGEVPQQTSCQSDAVSGHLQTEQHVQHSYFSEHATAVSEHASPGNLPVRVPSSVKGDAVAQESASLEVSSDEINRVPNSSLLGALLQFGMPAVDDQVCEQPDRVAVTTCMQIVEQVGMKQDSGPALAGCQVSRHMTLPVETSKAKPDAPPQQRQGAKLVGCGDALVPYMCSAVASLQVCFAYLCGMRVGEASHPGPEIGQTDAAHQVKHDHSTGVRVGEAKNPGPSPFGPELENMIKQYVMEAVREAIKEAFQNLGFSAPDWNAPVVPFNKLSAAIDATDANAVLEGVILANKQEVEHAKIMLQGSKAQDKFLLIYLAKEEKSQKIPGRIQDQLCFRDAIVLQCHSSAVSQSPTPAGLANAPVKVAPLQSIAVYVQVPKQYASDQLWSSFCKNASKTAATWAADRHVQPLDSFNWAEEKQRAGGQELQAFGIMRAGDLLPSLMNLCRGSGRYRGDKDLVALLAETDTGPLTLWASVAPARTLQKSQRKLPQGAVPVVAPKQRSTAFPTASKALTEPEVGADGKPVSGAKRTKCDVGTVPDALKMIEIAKDGNCIYRAVSEGLTWLSGGKLRVEHREMRAKAITHLQKHRAAYSAQWDGESPSGDPTQSFDDYLAASARDSSYGSPLEVEALARVFDVQIILIPCLADFAVMSFRTSQAKRVLVLWYHDST